MKKTAISSLLGLLLFLTPLLSLAQYNDKAIHAYIDNYKALAIEKMMEYKIPASITLAQGIFESACGTSRLAVEGNNHFGIKCHKDWTGDTLKIDDDELQECFRKYEKAEDSYTDHSLFLTTRSRYASLFQLDMMDYKAWARGLKAAGYATNPQYAERLIKLIEKYNIAYQDTVCQRLMNGQSKNEPEIAQASTPSEKATTTDKTEVKEEKTTQNNKTNAIKGAFNFRNSNSKSTTGTKNTRNSSASKTTITNTYTPKTASSEIESNSASATLFTATKKEFPRESYPFTDRPTYLNNKTIFIIAEPGDTYSKIAKDTQTTEKLLRKFNDVKNGNPQENEVIYLEHKSKRSATKEHIVKKGETLRYISQKYAVQLDMIFHYNGLSEKSIIHPGDHIKLQ